jgi:hypothetical protein
LSTILSTYLKNIRTKKLDNQTFLFCKVRKKYVVVTPEELVRQCLLEFIHIEFNFSYTLMKVEYNIGKNKERLDIAVFNNDGTAHFIAECKSPDVTLNQETIQQITKYNTILKAPRGIISNGINTIFLNFNT